VAIANFFLGKHSKNHSFFWKKNTMSLHFLETTDLGSDTPSNLMSDSLMDPTLDSCESPFCLVELEARLSDLWSNVQTGETVDTGASKRLIAQALKALTHGDISVVQRPDPEKNQAEWVVNVAFKQAILLAFRFFPAQKEGAFPFWWDKIPLMQDQCGQWQTDGIRVVPGAFIRYGAHLSPSCIIMPSFINMGAWIGQGTMIDGGAHIGSCAFIGNRCHISANVTIGGVLEPLQALPVIIEDDVFIGAGCHVVEGVHIGQGSVLGSGVILTSGTKIIVRETGEQIHGRIPPYSVLIPGSYATGSHGLSIQCAILAKTRQPDLSPKTALTAALRGE
jgi:2,3,4,5-tetrahydropyridine-2-carboxylate N-succinyltransferase